MDVLPLHLDVDGVLPGGHGHERAVRRPVLRLLLLDVRLRGPVDRDGQVSCEREHGSQGT